VGYDLAGNVTSASDINSSGGSVMGAWSYTYDTLNRLTAGHNTATTPASIQYANMYGCWAYDSFGNRTANDPLWTTACPAQESSLTPTDTYNTNNQMDVGIKSYDPSGNMTADSSTGNTYLYDGEGRICAVSSMPVPGFTTMTGYVYDAEGNRVAKGTITQWSCDPSVNGLITANGNETDYILGPGGEQVTELAQDANGTMNWQRSYVYAGGLIATYDPNPDNPSQPLPSFRLTDWLGTLRATTDAYGVAQGTCTGLPYGDGVTCSGDIPDNHHFTGKERDAESGNDYFGARYYASAMGRWLSPDWSAKYEPVPYAKMGDPQSLNLYAYLMNNPLAGVDADGHCGSGPNNTPCNEVKVTATVDQKPKFTKNVPLKDKDGNVVKGPNGKPLERDTKVDGKLQDKVTVNGRPAAGVQVNETNVLTTVINGKQTNPELRQGEVPNSPNGQFRDDISYGYPTDGSKATNSQIVNQLSTDKTTVTDVQTLTLSNIPGVGTCSATSTRVLTNIGPDGSASSHFTLTTTQPAVTAP
jgi:RHS repeat-associated protein